MNSKKPTSCSSCVGGLKNGIHPDHSVEIKRLNRVRGQISGIQKMIEGRRYCPDILQQLKAVHAAVKAVESRILRTHLEACVKDTMQTKNSVNMEKKISELMDLFK